MGRVRVSVLAALTMLVSLVTPAAAAAGNSSPTVPTGLSVGGCVFVCASPTRTAGIVTKDRTPLLTARSTDVDRNPIRYRFQLVKGTATVSDVTTAPLASGALGRFQVTQGLADGSDYRYRVVATDGVRAGAWSGWIGFAVDTVAPLAPKVKVVSKVSTRVDSFSGSIGESPVDVTLSEQTGGDRVWGYAWDVLPQNWTPAAPATLRCGTVRSACVGSVNADLKVPTFTVPDSISTFTAWAFDAAGNARSVASTVRLQALASRRPTLGHQWRTQGAAAGCSARLLADGATSDKRSLTVSSGVCRTRPEEVMPGQSVSVLRFTGSSGSADTAKQPMVDVTDNFTVAAWARPTALGTSRRCCRRTARTGPGSSWD